MLNNDHIISEKNKNILKNDSKTYKKMAKEKRTVRTKVDARTRKNSLTREKGMESFRLEVGHKQSVKKKNIVEAISNESGLDRQFIGRINIYDEYTEIDLPEGIPKGVFKDLKKVCVSGQPLKISQINKYKKSGYATSNFQVRNSVEKKKNPGMISKINRNRKMKKNG